MTDVHVLDVPTSHCKVCLETKPVAEFYLHSSSGRPRTICKSCHSAACAERNKAKRKGNRALSLGDRLAARRQSHPPIRPLREAAVTPLMVTLVERAPDGCAYPYGDSGDYRFCGLLKAAGKPYCSAHCEIAYRPRDEVTRIRVPMRWR
jgi:hypothetical protein